MGGGLFGKPFQLNIKCIIFSLIIMSLFLYKPNLQTNLGLYSTLFIVFVISYVVMAWYDYFYDCQNLPLKRGKMSVTGLFKPPIYSKEQLSPDTHSANKKLIIYTSHILLIVPLLLYIAIYKNKINPITYPLVAVLAVFTLLYHSMHLIYNSH
mgnify:CR=1 FL=1|uniref:Uncharacterized protein n=1 Tax=viral metagenome TaxID=1070528 RepID=A0A6C0EJ38_9ZZZZ